MTLLNVTTEVEFVYLVVGVLVVGVDAIKNQLIFLFIIDCKNEQLFFCYGVDKLVSCMAVVLWS